MKLKRSMKMLAIFFISISMLFFHISATTNNSYQRTQAIPKQYKNNVESESTTYTGSNWMGSIADNKNIASLSIPGTHDSGALYESVSGTAKCQNLNIADQLMIGVRYLDIRCRHIDDAFTIHHGPIYQHQNFADVLNSCYNFLMNNPTETIIMSVKEEHTSSNITRTFEQTFDSYVALNPSKWYLGETIPNLSDVRGKIVLVRRFGANLVPKGINCTNWSDNTTFTINNGSTNIKIQDQYIVPDNAAKWAQIQNLLNEAKSQNGAWLFINHTSGYKPLIFSIPSITSVSNYINLEIITYFTSNTRGRFGIIGMDFVDSNKCSFIISTNFI